MITATTKYKGPTIFRIIYQKGLSVESLPVLALKRETKGRLLNTIILLISRLVDFHLRFSKAII